MEINEWLKKNKNPKYSFIGVKKLKYKLLLKIFIKGISDLF